MAELTTSTFTTTGLHCRSCSMMVDMTLDELEGVESSETDYVTGKTEVSYDAEKVALEDMYAAIRAAGYDVA